MIIRWSIREFAYQWHNFTMSQDAIFIITACNEVGSRLCFLHGAVILFTGGGPPQCMLGSPQKETPLEDTRKTTLPRKTPGRHPHPEQCMLGDTAKKRAVRILLESILVHQVSFDMSIQNSRPSPLSLLSAHCFDINICNSIITSCMVHDPHHYLQAISM